MSRPKRRNSIDDEIRDLERKELEGPLSARDRRRLDALRGRSGGAVLKRIPQGELPPLDEFVATAEAWAEHEIRSGVRAPTDPPLVYKIDLTSFDSEIHDLALGSENLRDLPEPEYQGELTVESSRQFLPPPVREDLERRSAEGDEAAAAELAQRLALQNVDFKTFKDWGSVHEYVRRLQAVAEGELPFDDNLNCMSPNTEHGIWYEGEVSSGGFLIPPDVVNLGIAVPEATAEDPVPSSESIRVEDEIEEVENELKDEDSELTESRRGELDARLDFLKGLKNDIYGYVEEFTQRDSLYEIRAVLGWGAQLTLRGYMDQTSWEGVFATENEALRALADQHDLLLPEDIEERQERAWAMAAEIMKAAGFEWENEVDA